MTCNATSGVDLQSRIVSSMFLPLTNIMKKNPEINQSSYLAVGCEVAGYADVNKQPQ